MIAYILRTITFLIIIGLASFMTIFSLVFGTREVRTDVEKAERKVEVFLSKIVEKDSHTSVLEKTKISGNSITLGQSDTLYVEFGRLASAMFISETKTLETNLLSLS